MADDEDFLDDIPAAPAPKAQKHPKPTHATKKPPSSAVAVVPPKVGGKRLKMSDGPKRRQGLAPKDPLENISRPGIRRMCRRAGIKRISGLLYPSMRLYLKRFCTAIIKDAVTYTEHARLKTVTAAHIVHALARNNKTLYGFGS